MIENAYDVLVIGGGASGMMAAIAAAENKKKVLLLEKNNRLGEKLRISGGGRCNIWNEEHDERLLLANYGDAAKFLYSAFSRFGLEETIEFFHNLGLETKVEARNRAFPVSERAEDVVNALEQRLNTLGVTINRGESVKDISADGDQLRAVTTTKATYTADKYIFATGGLSRPETGSNGDGLQFLKRLGHSIEDPTPTITPLKVRDDWIKQLAGTTLKDVRISFYSKNKKAFRLDGDVLCTHFGISGPLILNNAHKVSELLDNGPVRATIDLFPEMDEKQLDTHFINTLAPQGARQLKNAIRAVLPDGTYSGIFLLLSDVDLNMNTADLTKDQRLSIVRLLKALPVDIEGLMGFDKAVVADGGVNIREIDMKTMQSTKVKNVYITGDLLHITRPSGGFSLQLCWTTGYLAGKN